MKKFSEDIRAAVSWLIGTSRVDADRVAVVGLSIGGSAAIQRPPTIQDPRGGHGRFVRPPRDAMLETGLGSRLLAPAMPLVFSASSSGGSVPPFDQLAPERHAGRVAGRMLFIPR